MWKLCFFIGMAGFYFYFELSPFSIGLGDLREEVSHYRELKRLQVAATISQSYSRGWCGYQHIARGRFMCQGDTGNVVI